MSDLIRLAPGLTLDADYVAGGTFALLGKKGSGKSFTTRVLAEEFWRAGVQFVLIDPMGANWGLRSSADGQGEGLPIPIFGGKHADAPLERAAGALMADLVVRDRLNMILDLSEFGSHAAERQFVHDFLDRLYRTNEDLVHVLLDEADLYAPQKPAPGDQAVKGVVDNTVRRGRNKAIAITLITQRSAVLDKDVLTQCDGVVLLRLTGPQDRDAAMRWVETHGEPEENAASSRRGAGRLRALDHLPPLAGASMTADLSQNVSSPDASHVTEWRPRRQESKLEYVGQRTALAEHFEAISEILESMGHRPFGRLELRMPGNSFDAQVIYRWERSR